MKKLFSIVAILSLVFSPVTPAFASSSDGTWIHDGNGNWGTAANWAANTIADGAGATANLTGALTGISQVNLDTDRTVGIVNMGDTTSTNPYWLTGASTLTFDNGASAAELNQVNAGANGTSLRIYVPILLNSDLNINNANTVQGDLNIMAGSTIGSNSGTITVSNVSSGNRYIVVNAVIQDGSGTVNVVQNSTNGIMQLNGANTYTGTTTITAGTIEVGVDSVTGVSGALGLDSAVTMTGGTLSLNNHDLEIGSISGTAGTIKNGGAADKTLTVGNDDSSTTFAGTFTDGGAGKLIVTKIGDGTLTLTGANSQQGGFLIQQGTVKIGVGGALSGGNYASSVSSGAALDLNGQTIATATEVLGIAGSGVSGSGALYDSAGGGSWTGNNIYLNGADATINNAVAATTLTIGAGGVLQLDDGATAGDLTVGGAGDTIISRNITKTGALTGGLIKNGSGALTLSGTNTFTGGVTLDAGTLNINSATALGGAAGTFTINSGTIDNTSGGAITLSNNNAQAWNSDFTFTGANNLNLGTGAVTLGGDVVATLSAAGKLLTVGGNVGATTNGLNIAGAGDATFTGRITTTAVSSAGLTMSGTGTVTLSGGGDNTNLSATISSGTLSLEKTVINAIADLTMTGGTVKLNGTSDCQIWDGGVVTINGGTLNMNAKDEVIGTLAGSGGTITNNAAGTSTLTAGGNNTSTTFSGIIQDGGIGKLIALTKTGTGTLTLTGANTYTGVTALNGGTFAIGTGGSLGGGDVTHAAASTFSIGLNTVNVGAYTMDGTSTLAVSIDGVSHGSVLGTGNALVNATDTLTLNVSNTFVPNGATYTIVNGTGGAGVVAPIINITGNTHATFSATTVGEDLILTASRTANGFESDAPSGDSNAQNVGKVLDGITDPNGDMATVLNTLDGQSAVDVGDALQTMTPDVSSGAMEGSRLMTAGAFSMVSNRLGGARSGGVSGSGVSSGDMTNGMGVWIQGLGSHMKQDERKGIQGFTANTWGTTIGVDKLIDNHFRAGLAGSYGWARVNSKQPGSPSDDINSWQGTLYGSYDSLDLCKARQGGKKSPEAVRSQIEDHWYVDGMFAFTQNDYDSRREIWLTPANKRVAKADHYAQQYSTNFEGGYTFTFEDTKALEVTPFASIGYNYLYMNKYKEKGAGALNLNVDGQGFNQLEQGLGTKLAYPMVTEKVGTFIPSIKAAWLYDYIGDRFETTASFQGGGPSFDTIGAKPAKNGILFGAELAFLNKGNITATGNWDMELKDEFMSNTYYGTVRYDF